MGADGCLGLLAPYQLSMGLLTWLLGGAASPTCLAALQLCLPHMLPAAPCSLEALPTVLQLLVHHPPLPPPLASTSSCTTPGIPVPGLCLTHIPSPAFPTWLLSCPSGACPLCTSAWWLTANTRSPALLCVTPCTSPRTYGDPSSQPCCVFNPVRWVKMHGLILSDYFNLRKLWVNVYAICGKCL